MSVEIVDQYFLLLGGDAEVRVQAESTECAHAAERAAVDELRRLEALFTLFDQTSALNRWRRGDTSDVPGELVTVLRVAQEWFEASGGAFHPATDPLRQRWLRAEDTGQPPPAEEMRQLAAQLRELPYRVDEDGAVQRRGDTEAVDLNVAARGFIVDRAAELAMRTDNVTGVTITAGSTLRHVGAGATKVPIPAPFAGGAPAVDGVAEEDFCVVVNDRGVSTRNPKRPRFVVGGQWYPQLFDARTGWPVQDIASVAVIAPDALTAHLAATVVEVLHPDAARDVLADRPRIAFSAVMSDGRKNRSANWPADPVD